MQQQQASAAAGSLTTKPNIDMSLQTDIIFARAIRANDSIMETIGQRLYNTAIPLPDEDADNVPVPYVILSLDALTNEQSTKDDMPYEGDEDNVQVGVTIAAETREQLAELAIAIRRQIRDFFTYMPDDDDDHELVPLDYQMSAQAVQYDSLKPCYWQRLSYQCETLNDLNDEE